MRDLINNIENLRLKVDQTYNILQIDKKVLELKDLQNKMNKSDFWNNYEQAKQISKQASELEQEINIWQNLRKDINLLLDLAKMHEKSLEQDILKKYNECLSTFKRLEFLILLSGKFDENDAIVAVHAGTGGVDAQDWAQMLLRMLLRFCEKKGFKVEIIDKSIGNEAGIKSCIFKVHGKYAYGYLKSENGVHRLVRISPFDAEKMRHTSFALIEVFPLIEDDIDIELSPKDLRIDTFRASGAGGQHVNKTESAVRIVHLPTGISVTCQSERSQYQNKETAMKILKSKLYQYEKAEMEEEKRKLRGEYSEAVWGNQIRSYVLHPYKLVKDLRTGYETTDVQKILDGEIDDFVEAFLKYNISKHRD